MLFTQHWCDMLRRASQEEEEALARALAERPDEDMDMANGEDDYPDEAEEVGSAKQINPKSKSWFRLYPTRVQQPCTSIS